MWEKHSDDDSIHDAGNTYSFADAVAVKIAAKAKDFSAKFPTISISKNT